MYHEKKIWVGASGEKRVYIYPKMANRHGLIAGATGSGKTVTLKVLAESFSDAGVPVFLADVKGDLAGMCQPGTESDTVRERMAEMGLSAEDGFLFHGYPTAYWDVFGEKGIPLRTTISEMGPLLLGKILGLNETQSDILTVIFRIADDEGLLLLDTKDLRAMLQYVGENAKEYSLQYGNIAKQSLSAIIRAVVALEAEGAELFFGEPALNLMDWFSTDCDGKGMIHILECGRLIQNPNMYSAFMLWMLSELFETLPERGDAEKPRMVFFFDEAHLLFDDLSSDILARIEQVVKLIRSKGVGIYFITQTPRDVPDGILAQLGNKIQHSLHAYTPAERKAVKASAESFRENPQFDTMEAIQALGVGEALISVLDEDGIPTVVERCRILPPQSRMGALEDEALAAQVKDHMLYLRYSQTLDRESAYELLQTKAVEAEKERVRQKEALEAEKQRKKEEEAQQKQRLKEEQAAERARLKEEQALEKQRLKEEQEAEKQRQKELLALQKQQEKELLAQQKQLQKEEEARERELKSAVSKVAGSAVGTLGRELGNNLGKQLGGSFGKKVGGNVGASLGRGLLQTFLKFR